MSQLKNSYLFYLSLIWLVVIVIVNPIGDFPLNDDWSYAKNVESLALENELSFHDWGAMTLIVHNLWGALFCKIFGFSFTVLRISTLVLGWGTLIATFLFFKEGGMKKQFAFWATILFASNLFFLANAFSYMTEVPFLFYLITASLFFLKGTNGKGNRFIIYGTIFSILATLVRQIGVLAPFAFFFVFILKNKFSFKTFFQAIAPSLFTFLSLKIFEYWREANFGLSKNYGNTSDLLDNITNGRLAFALENISYQFFTYWGLFLIPLLFVLIFYFWKKIPRGVQISAVVITLLCYLYFILKPNKDFLGNTFHNLGFGPINLPSSNFNSPPHIGKNDWDNLYLIAFIAGIFLLKWILIRVYQLFIFYKNKKSAAVNWSTLYGLTAAAGYFTFLMINNHHIDRYNIIAFPFLILFLVPLEEDFQFSKYFTMIGLILISCVSIYSISATHDYLSWNRARWEVTNFGTDDLKIQKKHINGGFEYKGWNDILYYVEPNWEDVEAWNTHHEQYKIAFSPQCKYNVIKSAAYTRYLPPRVDSMYLLQKQTLTQFDTILCGAENLILEGTRFKTNQENIFLENVETRDSSKAYRGDYSLFLNREHQYGFTFKIKNIDPCEKILVSYQSFPLPTYGHGVIVGEKSFYLPSDFRLTENFGTGWGRMIQEFRIPETIKDEELSFYIFNGSGEERYFDNLMIIRMK